MNIRNNSNVKLLLKVFSLDKNKFIWVHFCYVNKNLYEQFMQEKNLQSTDLNQIISQWCKKDFNKKVVLSSTEDIQIIREIVKNYYEKIYPEIFIENNTDHQGWLRVWITKNLKEELKIDGKESF